MLNHLRSRVKSKAYYVKIVTYIAMISLIPLLVYSSITYSVSNDILKAQLEKESVNYFNSTANAIDEIISLVDSGFRLFSVESNFRKFEFFPMGYYYENDYNISPSSNFAAYYDYTISKLNMFTSISVLKESNGIIDSIYFIDYKKDIVLLDNLKQYSISEFPDKDISGEVQGDSLYRVIISEPRTVRMSEQKPKSVITMIYNTPVKNKLIINLDMDVFYNNIIKRMKTSKNGALLVLSKDRKLIFSEELEELPFDSLDDALMNKIAASADQSMMIDYDGIKYYAIHMKLKAFDWELINIHSLNELMKDLNNLQSTIIILALIFAVCLGLATLFTSKRLYIPIKKLISHVNGRHNDSNESEKGEFYTIMEEIHSMEMNQKELSIKLKESLPAYKERFFISILKNNTYDKEKIKERMKYLDIRIGKAGMVVVVLMLDRWEKSGIDFDITRLTVEEAIRTTFKESVEYAAGETEEGVFAIALEWDENEFTSIFTVVQRLVDNLEMQKCLNCYAGISRYCSDLVKLPKAYSEAVDALKHRSISGESKIIYIEDIAIKTNNAIKYPREKLDTMYDLMIQGNTESALEIYDAIFGEFLDKKNNRSITQTRNFILWLYSSITGFESNVKVEIQKKFGEKFYDGTFFSNDSINDVIDQLRELVKHQSIQVKEAYLNKESLYHEKILNIIHESDEKLISLNYIAEKIKVSPAYLSRIFKKNMGISFVDYVTKHKIEKAKKLLSDSNLQVQDISNRLGYIKCSYFIKIFKDVVGVTPNEYRKIKI